MQNHIIPGAEGQESEKNMDEIGLDPKRPLESGNVTNQNDSHEAEVSVETKDSSEEVAGAEKEDRDSTPDHLSNAEKEGEEEQSKAEESDESDVPESRSEFSGRAQAVVSMRPYDIGKITQDDRAALKYGLGDRENRFSKVLLTDISEVKDPNNLIGIFSSGAECKELLTPNADIISYSFLSPSNTAESSHSIVNYNQQNHQISVLFNDSVNGDFSGGDFIAKEEANKKVLNQTYKTLANGLPVNVDSDSYGTITKNGSKINNHTQYTNIDLLNKSLESSCNYPNPKTKLLLIRNGDIIDVTNVSNLQEESLNGIEIENGRMLLESGDILINISKVIQDISLGNKNLAKVASEGSKDQFKQYLDSLVGQQKGSGSCVVVKIK